MSRTIKVSRITDWPGWCSPCESEDRPLVLTRTGPAGAGAWLSGLGDDDRLLLLTCNVCGHWQVVPAREEDDPEIVLVEDAALDEVLEVVAAARAAQPVAAVVPAARPEAAQEAVEAAAPVWAPADTAVDPLVDVPPVATPAAACAVPAPREEAGTMPAFTPEAVAAAARVLAAARAETEAATPRGAVVATATRTDSAASTASTASTARATRRPGTPVVVPAPRAAAVAAATSIVLPMRSGSQLVLATES